VDLDSVSLGDPTRDPAHFNAYLAARVGLEALSREQARALAAAFADEYFSFVPEAWRRQFALHSAGALIEVACGIFRHQLPDWRTQVAAAVEEARHALSGTRTVPGRTRAARPGLVEAAEPNARNAPRLSELDLALMRALWSAGEGTAREVSRNVGPSLSGATVEKMLERLAEKGAVARRVVDGKGVYRIVLGRAEAQRSFVENCASYADSLFEGDVTELVCQLLRARDVNARDLARVIDLLKARERELEGERA
jgi:predicted transcriptional regulator